jgi:hypothetical protein
VPSLLTTAKFNILIIKDVICRSTIVTKNHPKIFDLPVQKYQTLSL